MTLTTARTAVAAALLAVSLTACGPGEDIHLPGADASSDGWDMDWSTPHTRSGEPATGRLDLEEQAIALGAEDVRAEPVPDHPGWTRLTIRRTQDEQHVTGTEDYPDFDFAEMSEHDPDDHTYPPGGGPRRVTGPAGSTEATAFEQGQQSVVCVRFDAAGSGMLTNGRLGFAFVAPTGQSRDLGAYVRGLAVTDPQSHRRTDSPRVTVELGYLGSACNNDTAALARCADGTVPSTRDENWGPGYDLSTFTPTDRTPQGYDYQLKKVTYRQCTNECHDEPAVQLWVRVPADAHGKHPELFLLWSAHVRRRTAAGPRHAPGRAGLTRPGLRHRPALGCSANPNTSGAAPWPTSSTRTCFPTRVRTRPRTVC